MAWSCSTKADARNLVGKARYSFMGGYSDAYFGKPKAHGNDPNININAYNDGYIEGKADKEIKTQ